MNRHLSLLLAVCGLAFFSSCDDDNDALVTESPYQAGLNEVAFESEGETVVGALFLPEDYTAGDEPPVVVVTGPWTQVKEQVGYRYARVMADQGYAALAMDHRFWGESGGEPRFLESTREKSLDVLAAVEFLQTVDAVDADRLGVLGVCAGVGNVSLATAADDRIRAMATISPWVQHPETSPLFYGGEEGVQQRIDLSRAAQQTYEDTGDMPTVPAYDPNDPEAAMFFPVDYYGNPSRGDIPTWDNAFAVAGWEEWLTLNTVDMARDIEVPVRIVYGDETFLPDNIRAYFELLPNQAESDISLIEGEHTQFYDQDPFVTETAVSAAEHFDEHL